MSFVPILNRFTFDGLSMMFHEKLKRITAHRRECPKDSFGDTTDTQ